ncbi:MAG: hypothetical protein HC892_22015 [Saprospiraceae bacterium]|nr:hypothetical protein [Saprospiraceae bacterium]
MDTLIIKVTESKRDFLIALLREFSFVEVVEQVTLVQYYEEAVASSEAHIEADEVLSHDEVKKMVQSW